MSRSSEIKSQISAIQQTAETLSTKKPDTSRRNRSYQTIPKSLPSPTTPLSPETASTEPSVSDEFTIPHDDVAVTDLPFGTNAYDTWRQWRSKYTTIAALYVLAAEFSEFYQDHHAVHAMFSPPQENVTSQSSVRYWRAHATEIAEDLGIDGGVAAFHGFRVTEETATEFESHISGTEFDDTATDVLLWEWLRHTDDWREYVTWGPHIHILGLTKGMDTYSDEGIVKRLRTFEDEPTPVHKITAHRAVTKDIVDHLTFTPSNPMPPLSWFGDLQQGNDFANAKQYVTNTRLDQIREVLINGPSNPDKISSI